MDRRSFSLAAASALAAAPVVPAFAAPKAPATWEGLVRVTSKRVDYVYLLPGADFREYTKVMLDPTELAFKKNWLRDYNNTALGLSGRLSERDLQQVITKAGPVATELFADAYRDGGYPVVTEAGPDVLRVRTAVVNISVTAPEVKMAGRNKSFADEAGYATLIIEARDSGTGALLGRAVDGRVAGDNSMLWRTSMTNRSDFRILVKRWAEIGVKGLAELKARSPINEQGVQKS